MEIPSAGKVIEGIQGAFKGTVDGLTGIGGAIGGTAMNFKTQGLQGTMRGITGHAFAGAMTGLGISAIGLGMHAIAPNNIDNDGPVRALIKGGIVGAGFSLGIQAMGYMQPALSTDHIGSLLTKATEGGFIGKAVGMTGKVLGSRLFGAAAIGATGAMLMKSIISTNFVRPNN